MNKNEFLHGKFSIVRTLIVAALAGSLFTIGLIYASYKTTGSGKPYRIPPYARKLSPEEQVIYDYEEEREDREAQQKALEVKKQP